MKKKRKKKKNTNVKTLANKINETLKILRKSIRNYWEMERYSPS